MIHRVLFILLISLLVVPGCQNRPKNSPRKSPSRASFVFVAAGDYGTSNDAAATMEAMARSGADFILALGDFSYSADLRETSWCDYVKSKIGPDIPVQLVCGNHEDDSGGDGHIKNFAACLPDKMNSTGDYAAQYYFGYLNIARFIMLSPDLTINGRHYYYGDSNQNYRWVAEAIDDARAAGISWVIVGMHKSCLSMGPYYCHIYADLMNLLVEKKVDLVLHGHDHTYQRSKQLALGTRCAGVLIDGFNGGCVVDDGADNVYDKGKGALFVIAGTGGADLYEINASDSEAGYFAKWMGANASPRKGFMKFSVSSNELSAEFVGSTSSSGFADSFVIKTN